LNEPAKFLQRRTKRMNKKIWMVGGALVSSRCWLWVCMARRPSLPMIAIPRCRLANAAGGPGGPARRARPGRRGARSCGGCARYEHRRLSPRWKSGKTLQDLAEEAGVDMQEIKDALSAVRAESMRERIAQALEDGTISQEHADWLLEGLDKGFLNGRGFGFGRSFREGKEMRGVITGHSAPPFKAARLCSSGREF
jgi:hypothetical protein